MAPSDHSGLPSKLALLLYRASQGQQPRCSRADFSLLQSWLGRSAHHIALRPAPVREGGWAGHILAATDAASATALRRVLQRRSVEPPSDADLAPERLSKSRFYARAAETGRRRVECVLCAAALSSLRTIIQAHPGPIKGEISRAVEAALAHGARRPSRAWPETLDQPGAYQLSVYLSPEGSERFARMVRLKLEADPSRLALRATRAVIEDCLARYAGAVAGRRHIERERTSPASRAG